MAVKKVLKKPVSFAEDEQYIYDYADRKLSFSIYIKELILKDMQSKEQTKQQDLELNI